ncbi:MAG: hypothetical protein JSV49_03060 [Thermoplasmata archaeon]|nr:MAG: hypothetical protein JSV49_03060 [Thermoplasmata archaeon]
MEFTKAERWALYCGKQTQGIWGHWIWSLILFIVFLTSSIFFIMVNLDFFLGYFQLGLSIAWIVLAVLQFERRYFYKIIMRYEEEIKNVNKNN